MNDQQQHPNRVTLEAAVTSLGSKTLEQAVLELADQENPREFLITAGYKNFKESPAHTSRWNRSDTCPVSQYLTYMTGGPVFCTPERAYEGQSNREMVTSSVVLPRVITSAINMNDEEIENADNS